jgi:hypothetical protein
LKEAVASAQATFKFFWREMSWEARRIDIQQAEA